MPKAKPAGYSATQIALHWTIAVLVIFQILGHEGMEAAWRAFRNGTEAGASDSTLASLHVFAGGTIFVLALWRVFLRLTRGAPPLPEGENPILKFVANATHFLLYLLIIGMPISGSVAWFLGVEPAGAAHSLASNVLFWLVVLHVAAALAQHFWFRTDVLKRMVVSSD